ncbi:MAG TPA: ABC transporter substrate-binding protein [Xanthobacteraceae bacterium]|nr:ABC transporter substrate-binding protein [Xanthobacteraceae bacterium]
MTAVRAAFLAMLIVTVDAAAHAETAVVRVAATRSIANAPELIALRNGYFKELGLRVVWEIASTSAEAMTKLAQGRFQVAGIDVSADYFHALEKEMPVTIVGDRVSSPLSHILLLRKDLKGKIKALRDLKGRVVATDSRGSLATYVIGKTLAKEGLTVADIELVPLAFAHMSDAFIGKAIDAGLLVPPFVYQLEEQKIAVPFASADVLVEPQPITAAAIMVNTEWARTNPLVAQNYVHAWLRGVRDYCQGYHGAAVRNQIVEELLRSGTERAEILHKYPWPARSADGRVNIASLLDIQTWFVKYGLVKTALPAERLADLSLVEAALQKLGPFELINSASRLPGCRPAAGRDDSQQDG